MAPKRVPKKPLATEEKKLHDYELVLIISPEVVDEALNTTMDGIKQFITEKGGVISTVEQWGKRKLAYPLKRVLEGNYVLTQFKLDSTLGKELEKNLQISEEVLRHLLIKVSSK